MTDDLVGRVGRVVVRIRGGQLPGEVSLIVAGMPEAYLAYSDEPVALGGEVLIVRDRGDRGLDVVPWDYRFGGPGLPDPAAGQTPSEVPGPGGTPTGEAGGAPDAPGWGRQGDGDGRREAGT